MIAFALKCNKNFAIKLCNSTTFNLVVANGFHLFTPQQLRCENHQSRFLFIVISLDGIHTHTHTHTTHTHTTHTHTHTPPTPPHTHTHTHTHTHSHSHTHTHTHTAGISLGYILGHEGFQWRRLFDPETGYDSRRPMQTKLRNVTVT